MAMDMKLSDQKKKVAFVGASGFVGAHLMERMSHGHHSIVALSRSRPDKLPENTEWCGIDLFSAQSTFDGLRGVDTAIYLVHSMMPSSRYFQGDFHDTDLLLADNFARACVANRVRKIIYLGGVMPEGYVSPHLESRREVEEVLHATGIPVTVLRAGMIVGPGGSSFEILKTLVQRLPFMLLPEWTNRSTQAIFIDDIVSVIVKSIEDERFDGQTLDVVTGEKINYKELLKKMATALERKVWMIPVPLKAIGLSKIWVQIFGNSTAELVSPLVNSLLCSLPQVEPSPLIEALIQYRTLDSMFAEALRRDHGARRERPKRKLSLKKSVRSIQRLPAMPQQNCHWLAEEYVKWLPRFLSLFVRVEYSAELHDIKFFSVFLPKPLLELKYIRGMFDEDRQKFHIVGGLLSATTNTGWLEFRQVSSKRYTLSAIHEFVPAFPWLLYIFTQAPLHRFVMNSFGRYLSKKGPLT